MKPVEISATASPVKPKPVVSVNPPRPIPAAPSPSNAAGIEKFLAEFDKLWSKAQAESQRKLRALQPEARGLVEIQLSVNQLGLGTQLLTQTAEAVNGTIRRVQQLGAS